MEIVLNGSFEGISVRDLEEKYEVNLLAVNKEGYPEAELVIKPNMDVLVMGHMIALKAIKSKYGLN